MERVNRIERNGTNSNGILNGIHLMHAKLVRTFAVECGLWWNKPNACVRVFCSGMASHGRVSGQNVPSPPSLVAGDREDRNFGWHIVSLPKHPWTSVDPFAAGRSARYAIRRNKSGPRGVHYSAHASAPRPKRDWSGLCRFFYGSR